MLWSLSNDFEHPLGRKGGAKGGAKMYQQVNTSINKNQYLVSNPFQ